MAAYGYITLRDERQCLMSAGCSTQPSLGTPYRAGHENQTQNLTCSKVTARLCDCASSGAER
ncbi:hypothetical protein NJC40_28005 [Pseudomonas sp. 21LCFQ02]|uniref:hypothetical protein n=1 Tax=Pseudomonas sp. 21LCFQ02 TaxID=2957505 RepID=UPI00209B772D|nr:hypothetical protein [Pseudomonas sp. 21LCFQ02]MCO8171615.1 hypothetical protein [Pseudomonas sp. 21LCFQ02]